MRTKSIFKMSILLVLSFMLSISCNHGNKTQQQGNTGSNGVNLADTVWYGGGYGYLYFSFSKVYKCYHNNGEVLDILSGTYSKQALIFGRETIPITSITENVLKILAPNGIDSITYTRETDISLVNRIKEACQRQ